MKKSTVPDRVKSLERSQQKPKLSFGLEVVFFGSRPRLIETEFGQGVTCQDEIRPGKSRGDDSIQGEKLGEKESSAQKAWRCRR